MNHESVLCSDIFQNAENITQTRTSTTVVDRPWKRLHSMLSFAALLMSSQQPTAVPATKSTVPVTRDVAHSAITAIREDEASMTTRNKCMTLGAWKTVMCCCCDSDDEMGLSMITLTPAVHMFGTEVDSKCAEGIPPESIFASSLVSLNATTRMGRNLQHEKSTSCFRLIQGQHNPRNQSMFLDGSKNLKISEPSSTKPSLSLPASELSLCSKTAPPFLVLSKSLNCRSCASRIFKLSCQFKAPPPTMSLLPLPAQPNNKGMGH
jgi:hypothetical protein